MGKPSAPTPPNPIQTAAAQTSSNIGTGIANAWMNATNQYTPQGSLQYTQAGSHPYTDPTTGATYDIPQFAAVQSLSPYGQHLQDINQGTQENEAWLASGASHNLLAQMNAGGLNVDPANDPYGMADPGNIRVQPALTEFGQNTGWQRQTLDPSGQQQMGFDPTGMSVTGTLAPTGQQQYTFDDAGNLTRSYGDNAGVLQDRSNVESALFQRLQPQLDLQRNQLEQRLADQGIAYGSPAYSQAMDQLNRSQNDARLAVTAQGGQEQKLQEDIMAQRAGFQNAAQMQAYQQAQGRGQFANQAQQTAYQQALQSGQFANAAEAQAFAEAKARGDFANEAQKQQFAQNLQSGQFFNQAQGNNFSQSAMRAQFYNQGQAQQMAQNQAANAAQNAARQQWLQERYDQANQGINQISALMSGSQVQRPNYVTTPTNSVANTDIAGIINNNFSQNLQAYNAQNTQFQQLTGGLLGGLAGILSDEREKNVGDKMGTIFAANDDDETKALPVYEFSYKGDPAATRHVGPMAQDVEKIDPRAVRTVGGRKYIDATRMGSIMRPYVAKKAA